MTVLFHPAESLIYSKVKHIQVAQVYRIDVVFQIVVSQFCLTLYNEQWGKKTERQSFKANTPASR